MDPLGRSAKPISPCDIRGSYFYNRLDPVVGEQVAIVATRLESK